MRYHSKTITQSSLPVSKPTLCRCLNLVSPSKEELTLSHRREGLHDREVRVHVLLFENEMDFVLRLASYSIPP